MNVRQQRQVFVGEISQGLDAMLMYNSDEVQTIDVFAVPLHVRKQDEAYFRIRVFIDNSFRLANMREDVVYPLEVKKNKNTVYQYVLSWSLSSIGTHIQKWLSGSNFPSTPRSINFKKSATLPEYISRPTLGSAFRK